MGYSIDLCDEAFDPNEHWIAKASIPDNPNQRMINYIKENPTVIRIFFCLLKTSDVISFNSEKYLTVFTFNSCCEGSSQTIVWMEL